MPKFRFRNEKTGIETVVVMPASELTRRLDKDQRMRIGKSRTKVKFVGVEQGNGHLVVGTWPMKSYAMGINPTQRIEAMKADAAAGLGGVEYDENTGDAIFASPGARKRYCEYHGFFDKNGGCMDPQRRDDREREQRGLASRPRDREILVENLM